MAIDFTTLFTRLGKAFQLGESLLAPAESDVPTDLEDFLDSLSTMDETDQQDIGYGTNQGLDNYRSSAQAGVGTLVQTPARVLLQRMVEQDNEQAGQSLAKAIAELISQMEIEDETVDANAVTAVVYYGGEVSSSSLGAPAGNAGNGILLVSTQRGDGRVNEFIFSETIDCDITAATTGGGATWTLVGEPTASTLAWDYPQGSGVTRTIQSLGASGSNLVPNGTFEDEDSYATDLPDGWIASVATLGTTLKLTDIETQTVAISGTPTGGYYQLKWTDSDAQVHWTVPLAYNASAPSVQSALRNLPDLGDVTVSATGSGANLTHTITFTGVTNPTQLTSSSGLTGGTPAITHATTLAASPYVMRGARALELDSNGSQLTALQCPVAVAEKTVYGVCLWACCDVTPAQGVLTIDLVDGIGGTVLSDDEGNACSTTIDCTALTSSYQPTAAVFRTPTAVPSTVYLRIRITTAVSSGTSVFIDEVAMRQMTELYNGGLFVAAFQGSTDHQVGDDAQIQVVNDYAGEVHTWCDRIFGLRNSRLLLPSDNTGNETIPDSLIA